MTQKEKLLLSFEQEYLPKIFGFSVMKLKNLTEAEELAQEISLAVLRAIDSDKKIDNPNAFIWSIANHTFCKYLRREKYGSNGYLPDTIISQECIEEEFIKQEQFYSLRRELAFMTEKYRRVVIMHYYQNKSCDAIANVTGVSSGTVKWWLHEARKQIREGMNRMREYGEKSYNPERLYVSCQGTPGADNEPMRCVRSKLAQNILLAAYKQPLTMEMLCAELGVAAPYMEDEVKYLVENQLLKQISLGQYQTDFVILPGANIGVAIRLYNRCFPEYYNKLMEHIETYQVKLMSSEFNTAGFS